MPRKSKQSELDTQIEALQKPLESGAGNLSEADRAAIMGEAAPVATQETAEFVGQPLGFEKPQADPVTLEFAGRLAMLESRMGDLEAAVEVLAKNTSPMAHSRYAPEVHSNIAPATREEEEAYSKTNLALLQQNQKRYDGIQHWRSAGSPKLEPKVEERKGRAA